jgi:putative serine protease PepD
MGLWTDQEKRNGASYEWLHTPTRPAPPAAAPPPPAPPPRRRGRIIALGLAAVVAAVSAVVAVALVGGDEDAKRAPGVSPLSVSTSPTGQTRWNEIYRRVSAGVVSIQVGSSGGGATGSGFVISGDGTVLTNDHVVEGGSQVQVRFDDHSPPVPARVVGSDPSSDLAVLEVDPSEVPGDLRPLTLADSSKVRVGDNAIAIGFPLGLDRTATAGIISGLGRSIQAPNNFSIDNVIQTDAPINPGNSGGPLLDDRGRVIGINSQIATSGGGSGNVGIGFAVPSNTIREIVPRLQRGQQIRRAYLGVSSGRPASGEPGALIGSITPGGPADKAGLRAQDGLTGDKGDLIVAVNGREVTGPDDLGAIIGDLKPGEKATITYVRDGRRETTQVTLAERPQSVPGSSSP